jgi:serine/threonine protein phosphatase PrpC
MKPDPISPAENQTDPSPETSAKTNILAENQNIAESDTSPSGGENNRSTAPVPPVVKAIKNKGRETTIVLPNGMVGKQYAIAFDLTAAGDHLENVRIDEATAVGMAFNVSTLVFEGVPSQAGDHVLTLRYTTVSPEQCPHCRKSIGDLFKSLPPRQENMEIALKWIVNADPQSLWKNLPTDGGALYAKPDSAIDNVDAGNKKILAASQRGRSHAHVGSFRDDAFCIKYDAETNTSFLLVADGAGSAKYSRKGSEIACETVIKHLQNKMTPEFWENLLPAVVSFQATPDTASTNKIKNMLYHTLGDAAFAANKAIAQESKLQTGTSPKDYATTLLVTVCRKMDDGWFIAGYWVGDGGIGIYNCSDGVRLLGEPDGGEFAGQTRFLTMPEIFATGDEVSRRIRFEIVKDFTALIVMTDGVTDPKFQTDNNLQRKEKWDELWSELQPVVGSSGSGEDISKRLLSWLDFWSAGNHDDRTIAVMV